MAAFLPHAPQLEIEPATQDLCPDRELIPFGVSDSAPMEPPSQGHWLCFKQELDHLLSQ